AGDIRKGFTQFDDDESRRQFVGHLKFRLHLDYEALPRNSHTGYFPSDVLPTLSPDTTFIDCGAYDGDTIRQFLKRQGGQFRDIFAFEPDENNCRRLREYVSSLGAERAQRIHVYNAGVGSTRASVRFESTGNMSAMLSTAGDTEVEVLPLQEVIKENGGHIYLKYDVEGAEREALQGTEELIRRAEPILAVSIYHKPDDLWQLPRY